MLTFDLPQTLISAEPCVFEENGRSKVNIGRSKVNKNGIFQKVIWYHKFQERQLGRSNVANPGSSNTQMKPSAYDEYVNASKGEVQKGKEKGGEGKNSKQNWRQACSDDWRPDGCNLGHHCPKYHPSDNHEDVQYAVQQDLIHHSAQDL